MPPSTKLQQKIADHSRRESCRRTRLDGANASEAGQAQIVRELQDRPILLPSNNNQPAYTVEDREQPRECLMSGHFEAISDQELLQLILSPIYQPADCARIVKNLLGQFRTFNRVISCPVSELILTRGLGNAGVAALKAVRAAAVRLLEQEFRDSPVFSYSEQVRSYLVASMGHHRSEQFRVLFLDSQNCLLADEILWEGTLNRVAVYVRDIVKRCLDLDAVGLILAHNHPSGCVEPSLEDRRVTEDIIAAATIFEIEVFDHIIIGSGQSFSFSENGIL